MEAPKQAHGAEAGKILTASVLADVSSLADDMLTYIADRIPEIGEDDELRGLTLGSCSSNLEAVLSMVRHGIDVAAVEAPVTALEHARAMASPGHSVDVMLRFYRLGHEYFTDKLSELTTDRIEDPAVALRTFVDLERFGFRYIDRISSLVAAEYVAELDRRQNQARAERADVVRALLDGERVDIARTERVLSHRLTGRQIGFVCWVDDSGVDLEGFARQVGKLLEPITLSWRRTGRSQCRDGCLSRGTRELRSRTRTTLVSAAGVTGPCCQARGVRAVPPLGCLTSLRGCASPPVVTVFDDASSDDTKREPSRFKLCRQNPNRLGPHAVDREQFLGGHLHQLIEPGDPVHCKLASSD